MENLVRLENNLDNKDSVVNFLLYNHRLRLDKEKIRYIGEIRNLLSHNQKIDGEYPIEIQEIFIEYIEKIISYYENPPLAYDKAVKKNDIYYVGKDDFVYPAMKIMQENNYTHIPILDNDVVIGVFSDNTLFGALLEDELFFEKDKLKFSNELIQKYCNLDNHITEIFRFKAKNETLDNVKDMFSQTFKNQERLSMIFITENGKSHEKLLGIITPWDVLQ